jgi:2-dehydro-3-deoxyphosphooctonate aldolase (KDO 8-P synthase)
MTCCSMMDCQNTNVVTDRGTMFGYQDMIVDFSVDLYAQQYASTVLDVAHSLQQQINCKVYLQAADQT